MSQFNDLFLEPKNTQYGSHMVMTNVNKKNKTKFINIDTRFRDEYNYLQTSNYNITLPQRISEVKSISLRSIEIPMTFYNISSNLGNNYFKITNTVSNNTHVITIADGQYDTSSITTAINNAIGALSTDDKFITFSISGSSSAFIATNSQIIALDFAVTTTGESDKYNVKSKLGWLLGFRNLSYTVTTAATTNSEAFIDLNGPRYLYLALEEFNKGNQNSFVSPLYTSIVNKNIIARISLDKASHGYGTILPANILNGLLVSDDRNYSGKVDLLKLNVQLLDETGNLMALNGMDFSFCLEVQHE
jgi:hypothetical protein